MTARSAAHAATLVVRTLVVRALVVRTLRRPKWCAVEVPCMDVPSFASLGSECGPGSWPGARAAARECDQVAGRRRRPCIPPSTASDVPVTAAAAGPAR
ncbi:hypothetical protein GCM10009654_41600 [Streptomyces hebeiensis]|uniref:Secreted protein n=1 Tax=Streptomyces hebeiensis TaxID=229486 RepID=A0ABN1V0A1_9ACTN